MAQPLSHLRNKHDSLLCSCCPLPYAKIQRNSTEVVLVIQSRHGGATHTNVVTVEVLKELLNQMEER